YASYYQRSFFRWRSWYRVLHGDTDLRRAAARVLPKLRDLLMVKLNRLLYRGSSGEEQAADVPACLRLMAKRGVDTFLLVTEKDPGVDSVDAHFGPEMRALGAVPGFRREDVAGTDHTFTSLWAQQHVYQMITDHLKRRHLA